LIEFKELLQVMNYSLSFNVKHLYLGSFGEDLKLLELPVLKSSVNGLMIDLFQFGQSLKYVRIINVKNQVFTSNLEILLLELFCTHLSMAFDSL
jgi:hypothetical protein